MNEDISLAALAPVLLICAGLVIYCWVDICRNRKVRHLPKWAWAIIVIVSIPIGAIVYLMVGRDNDR